MVFYVCRFPAPMCSPDSPCAKGTILPVSTSPKYIASYHTNGRTQSFGTPIALLAKRFSAARVLPIMMVGFVRPLSATNSFTLITSTGLYVSVFQ